MFVDFLTGYINPLNLTPQMHNPDYFWTRGLSTFTYQISVHIDSNKLGVWFWCKVQIHGTRGYMAPEWRQTSPTPITTKIDVYSFGMVLLEIVSGRRNLQPSSNLVEADIRKPDWYFPLWALAKLESGSCVELVDPSLTGIVNPEEVERALQVAFWCINDMPERRPSMSDVVQMLEGEIPVKRPVPRPKFLEMLMISSSLES